MWSSILIIRVLPLAQSSCSLSSLNFQLAIVHATHGVGEAKLHEKATASVESANVGVEAVAKL